MPVRRAGRVASTRAINSVHCVAAQHSARQVRLSRLAAEAHAAKAHAAKAHAAEAHAAEAPSRIAMRCGHRSLSCATPSTTVAGGPLVPLRAVASSRADPEMRKRTANRVRSHADRRSIRDSLAGPNWGQLVGSARCEIGHCEIFGGPATTLPLKTRGRSVGFERKSVEHLTCKRHGPHNPRPAWTARLRTDRPEGCPWRSIRSTWGNLVPHRRANRTLGRIHPWPPWLGSVVWTL